MDLATAASNISDEYCPAYNDSKNHLIWDAIRLNHSVTQQCPRSKGLDPTKLVTRFCMYNDTGDLVTQTSFKSCLRENLKPLLILWEKIPELQEMVNSLRIMEFVGLTISLIALILSVIIFHRYRILRNNRTKIHKNLFTAMLLQVTFRLLQYLDQHFDIVNHSYTEYWCIGEIILLEFGKIAMVIWMFIEGLYLHNAVSLTAFQRQSRFQTYLLCGWGSAFLFTLCWVISMNFINSDVCWYLYLYEDNYWILYGPSNAIIIVNFLFLLNIIRILIIKLRQSQTSELDQVKKAVKAAIFLVPLMGLTNALFLIPAKEFERSITFAIWSFCTYTLTSFQGLIISVLYCFQNGEVKAALHRSMTVYHFTKNRTSNAMSNRKSSSAETGLTTVEERA